MLLCSVLAKTTDPITQDRLLSTEGADIQNTLRSKLINLQHFLFELKCCKKTSCCGTRNVISCRNNKVVVVVVDGNNDVATPSFPTNACDDDKDSVHTWH